MLGLHIVSNKILTLHEVAEMLGVHYMTVYRYVHEGHLPASKNGHGWVVQASDVRDFKRGADRAVSAVDGGKKVAPWCTRMLALLIDGNERGVVKLMESVLRSGNDLYFVYLDVLMPAMSAIGAKWSAGEIDIFIEHRASGIVSRSAALVGARFSKRGVHKGTVLIGSPKGEHHVLGSQMLGDLISLEGWKVDNLGGDVPAESFACAAMQISDVVAVCIASTMSETLPAMSKSIAKVKKASDGSISCFAGGPAVLNLEHAQKLGADYWAGCPRTLMPLLQEHALRN
jgi:excisionase family DNA binding protein